MGVHGTAIVDPRATLADDVDVGPYSVIGSDVVLGRGCRLIAHATVLGKATLGERNVVFPYATIGADPQDRSYAGEPTTLVVGSDNVFREQVTVHRGTAEGGGETRIGDRCLLMVGAHVAHDTVLGDDVTLANLSTLGGHVRVGSGAVLGGHVAVAPYASIGEIAFLAGGSRVENDVPPYVIAAGDRARVRALNKVGLERRGIPAESRERLERAFRIIFRSREPILLGAKVAREELGFDLYVAKLADHLLGVSARGH